MNNNFYHEFLEAVAVYIKALNAAVTQIDEKDDITPYANYIPLLFNDSLSPTGASLEGWIIDEIGGVYSFREATSEEKAWWQQRPKA